MTARKAVRVLPLPVGAAIRVWSPVAMAGQPRDWGSVGASNREANQAWIRGWKEETDIDGSIVT